MMVYRPPARCRLSGAFRSVTTRTLAAADPIIAGLRTDNAETPLAPSGASSGRFETHDPTDFAAQLDAGRLTDSPAGPTRPPLPTGLLCRNHLHTRRTGGRRKGSTFS
jgi:hypothetical protein